MQLRRLVCGVSSAGLGILLLTAPAHAQATSRVSVDSSGAEGNGNSFGPTAISADGRIVAFVSSATNLVAVDANGYGDVFVHDRLTGTTQRVSVDSSGAEANGESDDPAISADGRYVAFRSNASNLVAGDANGYGDVFVHDRLTGITERVSVDSSGAEGTDESYGPAIAADGQRVAFESYASNLVGGDTNQSGDVFVHDRSTGITERVSVNSSGVAGNDRSFDPAISADGQSVSFQSYASNLVAGDTNGYMDVFVHDRSTGLTERVSVSSSGKQGSVQGNSYSAASTISANGQIVAFWSRATNLVKGDTNGANDVFVHDRSTGITVRVSVDSHGKQGNANSSLNGPQLSADGQIVAFVSSATNLVSNDRNGGSDVFIHDRSTGLTERVSVNSSGAESNYPSFDPSISADGQIVAFDSAAWNFVSGDTNGYLDVFVHER